MHLRTKVRKLLALEFRYFEYWSGGYTASLGAQITQATLEAEMDLDRGVLEDSLPAILERLYVLRNQVLHGSASFGSRKNRDSLEAGVPVLERLTPTFRDIVRADEREARWGLPASHGCVPGGGVTTTDGTKTQGHLASAQLRMQDAERRHGDRVRAEPKDCHQAGLRPAARKEDLDLEIIGDGIRPPRVRDPSAGL